MDLLLSLTKGLNTASKEQGRAATNVVQFTNSSIFTAGFMLTGSQLAYGVPFFLRLTVLRFYDVASVHK